MGSPSLGPRCTVSVLVEPIKASPPPLLDGTPTLLLLLKTSGMCSLEVSNTLLLLGGRIIRDLSRGSVQDESVQLGEGANG